MDCVFDSGAVGAARLVVHQVVVVRKHPCTAFNLVWTRGFPLSMTGEGLSSSSVQTIVVGTHY